MDSTKKPQQEQTLNAHAIAWLEKLPEKARPKVIAESYPRIINRLSSLWKHPDEFIEYVDELLVDERGGRAGFPMSIASELATLKDYYDLEVHPDRTNAYLWDPRLKK